MKHRHVLAKVFLVLGLTDLVVSLFFGYMSGMSFVRFGLWVVLPVLFLAGVFDSKVDEAAGTIGVCKCGKEFERETEAQAYCSRECYLEYELGPASG